MKYTYYALFDTDKDDPTATNVTFPDIFCGVTCGYGEENTMFMAQDLLRSMLQIAPEQCGVPSSKDKMKALFPDRRIVRVTVEL